MDNTNPTMDDDDTVQVTLRVPRRLRDKLHDYAAAERRSVNQSAMLLLEDAVELLQPHQPGARPARETAGGRAS